VSTPVIVDQPGWGHLRVTGGDRLRFLHGLTTANVEGLAPGGHTWGAILSPKGRVLSVIEVVRPGSGDGAGDGEHVMVHVEPSLTDKTLALLEKHAMLDDVAFERIEAPCHRVWQAVADVWDAAPVLAPAPGLAAGDDVVEAMRVEAGMVRYGVDVDEDCFPFETPLARYLDYQKGCYIGQEPVFRVYSQGKAARAMRGLRIDGGGAAPRGATVAHPAKADAGHVTSSVVSPRLGPIALAYLHRSAWDVGGTVLVDGRTATVVELPFA
jgi:tRNA-modifying protein YgfZ